MPPPPHAHQDGGGRSIYILLGREKKMRTLGILGEFVSGTSGRTTPAGEAATNLPLRMGQLQMPLPPPIMADFLLEAASGAASLTTIEG